ncbi:MAG: sterol carrier protein domain-containing protein [Roseiflexaceae bacterium]
MSEINVILWDDLTPAQLHTVNAQVPTLAQWRLLPRARASSVAVAWQHTQLCAAVAVSHDRYGIDGATIDVAVIREIFQAPTTTHAVVVETVMQQALSLLAEGIGIIMVHGSVSEWAAYGFAPISLNVIIIQQDAPKVAIPQLAQYAIPTADTWSLIQDMSLLQSRRSPALFDTAQPPQRPWLMLAGRDGQLRAAADIAVGADTSRVYAAVASDDGAAYDLLQQLWCTAVVPHKPSLHLSLVHPFAQAALAQYGVVTFNAASAVCVLAGVIDLPLMLNALVPAFERRLRTSAYANWQGGVRVEISDERAMLMINAGRVTVIDGTREADVRIKHVDVAALAQLAFGYRSVAVLRRTGLLHCDDTELPLCDVLFPACNPVIVLE